MTGFFPKFSDFFAELTTKSNFKEVRKKKRTTTTTFPKTTEKLQTALLH